MKHLQSVHAGFLPLIDASVLIVASELGFDRQEGVQFVLHKESSWANIRDRLSVGHFQVAHCLAALPIAAALGAAPLKLELIVPMSLGFGGNAVTFSNDLAASLHAQMSFKNEGSLEARGVGEAFARIIRQRRAQGQRKLVLGVVHPHSGHNYDLRYWLAALGVNPDEDLSIVVVPPPLMPDALESGRVDGFCVGEPWNSVAMAKGQGEIVTSKSAIWKTGPEKVLAVAKSLNEAEPETVRALVRALFVAASWCADKRNTEKLSHLLAKKRYLGWPAALIRKGLEGKFQTPSGRNISQPDFFVPFAGAATQPRAAHALWLYSQMVRWGQASWDKDRMDTVTHVYRPDIYQDAISSMQHPSEMEGGQNDAILSGFFDGAFFDPARVEDYLRGQMAGRVWDVGEDIRSIYRHG
ncbi:CmpA/NrtA family ABC transporter substrate-binding protein [Flexibacterium corallicola]|uniref:CmpA/NrtA family ABC transporter substrate-binding protein n=1 Tax=Flexibacterium corallicola TaxID=3037259 RepID=UPI00286F6EF2|nr:CmpA/NrtA family ABC transporter substrate-binding protein [Pseudovibrio sp. M1P-2-3]